MAKRTKNTTVRERVGGSVGERDVLDERSAAMRAAVGIRKVVPSDTDVAEEIRELWRGSRIERIFFE